MEIVICERCGKKLRESDAFVDEDTHDVLCAECYHGI